MTTYLLLIFAICRAFDSADDPSLWEPAPIFASPLAASSTTPSPALPSGYPAPVGERFSDCVHCPEMMVIPSGSFVMGSPDQEAGRHPVEGPQREVRLSAPLAVGRFPITVGQYRSFVRATGRRAGGSCIVWTSSDWETQGQRNWRNPYFSQTDRDPVVCVSWEEAQAYAQWLSERTGRGYRLLTEAEWEYAARAGTQTRWWWGEDEAAHCQHENGLDQTRAQVRGWYGFAALCSDGFLYTSPVGRFAANAFGLHDMSGNAAQWVQDCHLPDYMGTRSDSSEAVEFEFCSARGIRGGGWSASPRALRVASRSRLPAGSRMSEVGFRLARMPGP